MKCKRIIKVVSALALTVALLVSASVVSFAATYTTQTTYINEDTIEVISRATGLNDGEMATYVAYRNGEFSETNAVYIDQATEQDNAVEFRYQADSDDVKATVLFGGESAPNTLEPDKVGHKITVYVNEVAQGDQVAAYAVADYDGEYLAREFSVNIENGKAIKKVEFAADGAEKTTVEAWYVKNGALVVLSRVIESDGSLYITAEDATISVKLGAVTGTENTITAFAKAVCTDDADYGILIADSEVEIEAAGRIDWKDAEDYTTPVYFNALGKGNNGVFAVEVTDEDCFVAGKSFNVKAYADSGETEVYSIDTVTVRL